MRSESKKQDNTDAKGRCPICKKVFAIAMVDEAPFCSSRCKQIDLGRWIDEKYTISRPIEQSDIEEED